MKMKTQALGITTAMIVAPAVVLAQSGLIVTSPAAFPAPALGAWTLLALTVALAGGAVWMLRRRKFSAAAQFAVVLAIGAVSTIGYATSQMIIVSGDECNRTVEHPFNPSLSNGGSLVNECTNAIRVVTVDVDCNDKETLGGGGGSPLMQCNDGVVLQPGNGCELPNPCYD